MSKGLDYYVKSLTLVFKKNEPRVAHGIAKDLFIEMAKDRDVFFEIVKRNIQTKNFFSNKRINPVIAMTVVENPYITIIAHFWLPRPDRSTTITHQSIHHHGKLLLTSVSPFGPGYESILFRKGFQIDPISEHTTMQIDKYYANPLYNIEFVDSYVPHVVFYPKSLSVTYAAWTFDKHSLLDRLRKHPLIQKNKKQIIDFLNRFQKIKPAINKIEYFDFYPETNHLQAMKERVMYPVGSNENFIQNVFYIIQEIGFRDYTSIEEVFKTYPEREKKIGLYYLDKLKKEEHINDYFEEVHLHVPKINFHKDEILSVTHY
jgi:hypothetical protein